MLTGQVYLVRESNPGLSVKSRVHRAGMLTRRVVSSIFDVEDSTYLAASDATLSFGRRRLHRVTTYTELTEEAEEAASSVEVVHR